MTEPRRWIEDEAAPGELRALLAAGRPAVPLGGATRQRSARRVAALSAVPVGIGALLFAPSTLFAAVLGAGAGLVVSVGMPLALSPAASLAPATSPAVAVSASPVVAPRAVPSVAVLAPEPAVQPGAPRAAPDSLHDEALLLERARAALTVDPERALALCDRHASEFARGKLSLERELIEVAALRRLGRVPAARARVEALLVRARGTLYAARVDALADELGVTH